MVDDDPARGHLRVLAVSDEVYRGLYAEQTLRELHPDLLISCGDLPAEYLEYLMTALNVPMVYVPGNHDPDERRADRSSDALRLEFNLTTPGPDGGLNADGRIVEVQGLRIAGLGGCVRYSPGPNQYTQAQMWRRAARLVLRDRLARLVGRAGVDILITHAPVRGLGDLTDPAHRGFAALRWVAERLRPAWLLHGHVHPYGMAVPDRRLGDTVLANVIPYRLLEIER